MTHAGCKTKKGKRKKHTPIVSKAQQGLFGAELGRRRAGKARKMRGITTKELESHLEESKGKKLPKRKEKSARASQSSNRYDSADLKARKKLRQKRAG